MFIIDENGCGRHTYFHQYAHHWCAIYTLVLYSDMLGGLMHPLCCVGRSCRCNEPGRPRLDISKECILSLRQQLNYSWTKIGRMLDITLYRRLHEYRIKTDDLTSITDSELDRLLKSIKTDSPNIGEVMLQGMLVLKYVGLVCVQLSTVLTMLTQCVDDPMSQVEECILLHILMLSGTLTETIR